jgi:hypothetical protein
MVTNVVVLMSLISVVFASISMSDVKNGFLARGYWDGNTTGTRAKCSPARALPSRRSCSCLPSVSGILFMLSEFICFLIGEVFPFHRHVLL